MWDEAKNVYPDKDKVEIGGVNVCKYVRILTWLRNFSFCSASSCRRRVAA